MNYNSYIIELLCCVVFCLLCVMMMIFDPYSNEWEDVLCLLLYIMINNDRLLT